MSAVFRQPPPPERTAERSARSAELAALRAALISETRIAEALAQRSRTLVRLVETLARQSLRDASDVADAEARLGALSGRVEAALAAGEGSRPGCLRALVGRTLAPFEMERGPRISCDGPAIELAPDAARLVALTLFELASRAIRFGALAVPEGRAAVGWMRRADGSLRIAWREYGAQDGTDRIRAAAGGALLDLLEERFGAPLRVRAHSFGLTAELVVPAHDLGDGPARPRLCALDGDLPGV